MSRGVGRRQGPAGDGLHPRRPGRARRLPGVRCLVALDGDGRALTASPAGCPATGTVKLTASLDPGLHAAQRRGGGFPRRDGVPDRVGRAGLQGRGGAEFLSLSGAPLARIERGEQAVPLQRVLDVAGRALRTGLRVPLAAGASRPSSSRSTTRCTWPTRTRRRWVRSAAPSAGPILPHLTLRQALRMLTKV